ncbi:MAG: hypothetical protein HUU38_26795 [Anaerolineales bacterium]|jgi:hypothetical protein|nr:hypothetical protein [Anaerolineales bacterium]
MQQVLTTIPAHFDGKQILLDIAVDLKPNARLLVTVLPDEGLYLQHVREAMKVSEPTFARIWDNEEDAVYDNL